MGRHGRPLRDAKQPDDAEESASDDSLDDDVVAPAKSGHERLHKSQHERLHG